jgi:hypothetical protein
LLRTPGKQRGDGAAGQKLWEREIGAERERQIRIVNRLISPP